MQLLHHGQRGETCAAGVVRLIQRRAEDGHNGVAHVFVEQTLVLEHLVRHGGEIFIQQLDQFFRRQFFGNGCKTPDIGKQDG